MPHAVAVDLGASSGRIALGELSESRIRFEIVEQIQHEAIERNGRLRWDLPALVGLCQRAGELAAAHRNCTIGIDAWGVDHGFLNQSGELMDYPVCYRDLSHLAAFEALRSERPRLYSLTGIQHQPFNTICQLVARKAEQPNLPAEVSDWMLLPDLLGHLLGAPRNSELTECSTTQLLGLDGGWSPEAFAIADWPVPEREVRAPGFVVGKIRAGVDLVSVGSHDTASAVLGFGALSENEMFLNVGTWSLAGCILPNPISTRRAEALGFTNERTVDGGIRFLKNIPGFYFINRLHAELGIEGSVPNWLRSSRAVSQTLDLFHPDFFNPDSMRETCLRQLATEPDSTQDWAALALGSLARAVHQTATEIHEITGRRMERIRIGGGGSQSDEFCKILAQTLQVSVFSGPAESTVLGNLAAQFLAQGHFLDWPDVARKVSSSLSLGVFNP